MLVKIYTKHSKNYAIKVKQRKKLYKQKDRVKRERHTQQRKIINIGRVANNWKTQREKFINKKIKPKT